MNIEQRKALCDARIYAQRAVDAGALGQWAVARGWLRLSRQALARACELGELDGSALAGAAAIADLLARVAAVLDGMATPAVEGDVEVEEQANVYLTLADEAFDAGDLGYVATSNAAELEAIAPLATHETRSRIRAALDRARRIGRA